MHRYWYGGAAESRRVAEVVAVYEEHGRIAWKGKKCDSAKLDKLRIPNSKFPDFFKSTTDHEFSICF